MIAFTAYGAELELRKTTYSGNNRLALFAFEKETGEGFAALTVNFPEIELAPDEFAIKNWSENEELAKAAFSTELFVSTGKCVESNFERAPIWKFKDHCTLDTLSEIEQYQGESNDYDSSFPGHNPD